MQEGATSRSVLQCIWQATWLLQEGRTHEGVQESASKSLGLDKAHHAAPFSTGLTAGRDEVSYKKVKDSIDAMCEFESFMLCMAQSGFDPSKLVLKIPRRSPRLLTPSDAITKSH